MTSEALAGSDESAVVTVVTSAACHFCSDADEALAELALTHPLVVRKVDVSTPEGQALVRLHRPPMTPLVLLDGMFFSFGRLPRRKLAGTLERRRADEHTHPGHRSAIHEQGGLAGG